MEKELISIIVPCYNEEESVPLFYDEIKKEIQNFEDVNFELIFVNDGSKDKTLDVLKDLSDKEKIVKFVSFSRNFGKESALYAGLKNAKGDYIAVMDADLQDPPSLLFGMYNTIKVEGYDIVGTRRVTRKGEPVIRSFFARSFYRIINKMSKIEMVDGARDFRLMTRQVVDSILELGEYNRFCKGIFAWVGYKTKWLEYENIERVAGQTKWNFWGLFKYALEGMIAFSTTPLILSSLLGIIFFIVSMIMIIFIIIRTLVIGDPTSGWPSLICVIFLVSGVQLFCIGILGQYLSKTYLETKKRPIYVVKEKNI